MVEPGWWAAGCVTPFYWDPLGRDPCAQIVEPWQQMGVGGLDRAVASTALSHPLAYAAHRLAHLNSTERWLVPAGWPGARPIYLNQPSDARLAPPSRAATRVQRFLAWLTESPLGWPFVYVGLLVIASLRMRGVPPSGERALAIALAVSGLALEASFGPVSVASDLRYHMWPMLAACLALILPARKMARRTNAATIALLLVMIAAAIGARLLLHLPPSLATKPAATVGSPAT